MGGGSRLGEWGCRPSPARDAELRSRSRTHLGDAVLIEEDVGRFEVEVQHGGRAAVQIVEPPRHLPAQPQYLAADGAWVPSEW